MQIEVTQCSMCTHYNTEQFCEVWEQYITNDAFYCACGVKADRKTENSSEKPNNCEDCNGCKFVGTYDTEFPCANCSRKTKDYYAKDEPQTCSVNGRPYSECGRCEHFKCTADEPQERSE